MTALWLLALVGTSETLYESPCQFSNNLPIATLKVAIPGHAIRSLRLLIDSGANRSFLFPGMSQGAFELKVGEGSRMVSLGRVEFAAPSSAKMNADAAGLMIKLGVDGSLGVDFLRTHDVLLKYSQGRILFSRDQTAGDENPSFRLIIPERSKAASTVKLSGPRVQPFSLVEQDDIFFVPATVSAGEPAACLMALDTGTGESALPMSIASKLRPTGLQRKIVGFQGKTQEAKEYLASISMSGNRPRPVAVLGSDARGPILGGNAFAGHSLLLQLRLSRAFSW